MSDELTPEELQALAEKLTPEQRRTIYDNVHERLNEFEAGWDEGWGSALAFVVLALEDVERGIRTFDEVLAELRALTKPKPRTEVSKS